MNDSYKTMPDSDYPEHIDLSNNHLRQADIIPFIKTLRRKLKTLNLRNNKLGPQGCIAFSEFLLDNPLTKLTQLNCESNNLKDKAGKELIDSLQVCNALTHLNLNSNELSSKSANKLDELIQISNITHLELHYNNILGADMVDFATKINESKLQILDLSWNNLGTDNTFTEILFEKLADNKLL